MKHYKSKSNPKLEFFVEQTFQNSYMIVSQVKGYDATEAHADWFKYQEDAEEIAQQLANES
jgi:uncharacterized membrane-anchored protein YjiN (DUF445 family)